MEQGLIEGLDIAAGCGKTIVLDITYPSNGITFLKLIYKLKFEQNYIKEDHELGFDQLLLKEGRYSDSDSAIDDTMDYKDVINLTEDEKQITIQGADFLYVYNKIIGTFDSLVCGQISYLDKPMEYSIFRAPTDNDRNIKQKWQNAGYDRITVRVYDTNVNITDKVVIESTLAIAAIQREHILDIKVKWSIDKTGHIEMKLKGKRNIKMPFLPRFGLRLYLPKTFDETKYFAYGPYESYIDKHRCSYLGLFKQSVSEMYEDYIRPQENSSHFGCQFLEVSNGRNNSLKVNSMKDFSFNVSEYTWEELSKKEHNFEIEKSGHTIVSLDYKNSGIGSNSCGPELIHTYRLEEEEIDFQLSFDFIV